MSENQTSLTELGNGEKKPSLQSLEEFSNNVLEIWRSTDSIRKLCAAKLTPDEFKFFMSLGITLKANPFSREIWAVKYDANKPAAIFMGRDYIRRKAQEQPDYDGHSVHSVYSNDVFEIDNGVIHHEYGYSDRGDLVGAYCFVYRKGMRMPIYVFVKFSEYDKQQSLWKTHPETMIKKVAEAQALRMAYQGVFQGTYSEDENYINDVKPSKPKVKIPKAIEPEKSLGDENIEPENE